MRTAKVIKKIRIMHTTDVHGALFTHDFIENAPSRGALSKIYAYVQKERERLGENLILLDGGDVLQGQPTSYYSNFVNPSRPHLVADMMNAVGYDACCVGNHDIEMGHPVYDRFREQCRFPVLAANLLSRDTGQPYFQPYVMLERNGVRIAVLGLVTSAIPHWVPEEQWKGIEVENMVDAARKWVRIIQEKEQPDLLVGLFHSGWNGGIVTANFAENDTERIAREVAGFDLICYGHDHQKRIETVDGPDGRKVYCVGLWSLATCISQTDVHLEYEDGKLVHKRFYIQVHSTIYEADQRIFELERRFVDVSSEIASYVNRCIGTFKSSISCQDAYFGSSAFIDLIHDMQLQISGAQISFAAPLSFDARIDRGNIHVRDMFHLYKFENLLCTLRMTGREIRGILEMSYALWTNQMQSPDDPIMLMGDILDKGQRKGFVNLAFNFDSAAGIRYVVDVTKPEGQKIQILSMADGSPFFEEEDYLVVTNSYRANGGGELFTRGAGLEHSELLERILSTSEKDIRYYFMEYIEQKGEIDAHPMEQWHFVPEEWTEKACIRDRALLFGSKLTKS